MALSRIGTVSGGSTGIGFTVSPPAGWAAGDFMLVAVCQNVPSTSMTITPPSGWTTVVAEVALGTRHAAVWARKLLAGDTSFSWTMSTNNELSYAGGVVRGADEIATWVIGATRSRTQSGTTTTTDAPGITLAGPAMVLPMFFEATTATETGAQITISGATKWAESLQSGSAPIETVEVAFLDVASASTTSTVTATYPNTQAANGLGVQIGLPTAQQVLTTSASMSAQVASSISASSIASASATISGAVSSTQAASTVATTSASVANALASAATAGAIASTTAALSATLTPDDRGIAVEASTATFSAALSASVAVRSVLSTSATLVSNIAGSSTSTAVRFTSAALSAALAPAMPAGSSRVVAVTLSGGVVGASSARTLVSTSAALAADVATATSERTLAVTLATLVADLATAAPAATVATSTAALTAVLELLLDASATSDLAELHLDLIAATLRAVAVQAALAEIEVSVADTAIACVAALGGPATIPPRGER